MTMQAHPFPLHRRPERALIFVAGADAPEFLQGLLTCDVRPLGPGQASYAALLQPQGKILFDFFLLNDGERYLIDCSAEQKPDLLKRLSFYKLRAKVEIGEIADCEIGVAFQRPAQGSSFEDPRFSILGWRVVAPLGTLPAADGSAYRFARIELGIADTDEDIGSGKLFPHEANLDQLGGVSFTKGCFIGQEVVSRMQHRGTARSRILPVRVGGVAPPKGAEIRAGNSVIGTVLSSDGEDALALIRLDRLKEAVEEGRPILTEERRVHVRRPEWARFDVPQATVEAGG
ncbi:MAG: YgfZ/GcvT domain-containing protein [Hyphomicrobiales bacterium]